MKNEFDEKYGIIKYNNNFYKSYALFEKNNFYKNEELDDFNGNKIKKFFVPSVNAEFKKDIKSDYENCQKEIKREIIDKFKIYKNRYYLKVVKPNTEFDSNNKILSFILFNSSYANQFKLDPTIQNCAYLTFYKQEDYDGFEIFNLFPKRNSVNILSDSNEDDENIRFISEKLNKRENTKIVLAWGYGKKTDYQKTINSLLKKLGNKKLEQIIINDDTEKKMMHPGNQSWNRLRKPFREYAKIISYTDKI